MPATVVITIARQLGSGGARIGQSVARRLGYALIDRQILQQAARELRAEEPEVEDREERLLTINMGKIDFATSEEMIADLALRLSSVNERPRGNEPVRAADPIIKVA